LTAENIFGGMMVFTLRVHPKPPCFERPRVVQVVCARVTALVRREGK